MIQRISSPALALFLAIFASVSVRANAADTITEDQIHALIQRVDDAIIKRDVPALLASFTDDAAIISDWLSAEGVSKKKFTKPEYGEYVKEQFPTATKRERTDRKSVV